MGRQTTYSVTAYLMKEDYDRIQEARNRVTPPASQSRVVRDYILGGFAAEAALKAGADTYLDGNKRYPAKLSKANLLPAPRPPR